MGRARILLLAGLYLAVPLLLVAAEFALRIWMPELDRSLVRPVTFDGMDWYEVNRSYPAKYFPPGTPLIPEFKPALFHRTKPPGGLRIFCLGESSMFGTPYQMTAGIPGILRKQLRYLMPGRDIEVVNWGASAINSNVILDISHELVRFKPDLVVLYAGHNEFYGPDGAGAGWLARLLPASIQWKYRLRDLYLMRWLFERTPPRPEPGAERNLMRQVAQEGPVPLASPEAERIFARWASNLSDLLAVWKQAGVPIIVCDVSSNLMFPPFLHDTLALNDPRLKALRFSGEEWRGDVDTVAALLQGLRAHDSTNAFLEYWSGRAGLLMGDTAGARRLLVRARDLDLLKFRAPSRINAILHEVCSREGVRCLSSDSLFMRLSPGGIPGDALFWEHLHPTLRGYFEIATMAARAIDDGPMLPLQCDTLSICWLDRAYGDLSIARLTGRWPFMNYHRDAEVWDSGTPPQQAIARAVHDRKIGWDQGCYESASQFWKEGDLRSARTTYEALLEEYPFGFYPHYLLANLLGRMGIRGDAIAHLRRSIRSNPNYPQSRRDLGLLLINEGDFDGAIAELTVAAGLPSAQKSSGLLSGIYYGMGAARANRREYVHAREALQKSLQLDPRNTDARQLLARLPAH